jgi:hypothetical protein
VRKENEVISIVVLQGRWVLVGVVRDDGRESGEMRLLRAHVVQRWGTTKGLGQLVAGPRPETVLDALPAVDGELAIPYHSVIFTLQCDEAAWKRSLGA